MATISQRLARVRRLYNVDSSQYTDANALIDLNSLIREAFLQRKVNWDYATSSLVANQEEYRVEEFENQPDDWAILQVNKVWVKYGSEFKRATYVAYQQWDEDTKGSETSPIYYERDNAVFISPVPTATATESIRVEATYEPLDVALTTEERTVKLPLSILDVILEYGLGYFIEMEKDNPAEAAAMRDRYKAEMSKKNGMIGTKSNDQRPNGLPQEINTLI